MSWKLSERQFHTLSPIVENYMCVTTNPRSWSPASQVHTDSSACGICGGQNVIQLYRKSRKTHIDYSCVRRDEYRERLGMVRTMSEGILGSHACLTEYVAFTVLGHILCRVRLTMTFKNRLLREFISVNL